MERSACLEVDCGFFFDIKNMKEHPNYYAIIPANVRYSNISANAKLLYGEITALTVKEGYCWASNLYFADLYQVTSRAIQKRLKELVGLGVIRIELNRSSPNNSTRKIWITNQEGVMNIRSGGHEQMFARGHEHSFTHNNTSNNNTSNKGGKKRFTPPSQVEVME